MRLRRALRLLRRRICRRQGQGIFRDAGQPGRTAPRPGLRLPILPGQAGMPAEGDDPDGQEFAGTLRTLGSLGAGGPRRPDLPEIMTVGGWETPTMPARYTHAARRGILWTGPPRAAER